MTKRTLDIKRVMEIYNNNLCNQSKTARIYANEINETFDSNFRRKIADNIKRFLENSAVVDSVDNLDYDKEFATLSALKADGTIMTIQEYCEFYNLPFDDVKSYKLVNHTNKAFYNIQSKNLDVDVNMQSLLSMIKESILTIKDLPSTIHRENDGDHLLFVDPADIHIGKYASEFEVGESDKYNPQIAYERVHIGIDKVITSASAYSTSKILFIIGNDVLHTDNTNRQTTKGTNQDTSGMWYENFILAKKLYIEVIMKLVKVADVHVQFNPSNHDYMSGFMLAEVISAYFHNCNNVTFDTDMSYRKYFQFGENLIGTTHGDAGKHSDYPLAMAHEAKDMWSTTKHRYFYIHHIHSTMKKDFMSVQVESLRSVSGADSWHHKNLYQHAPKTISCMVHHLTLGKVATLNHTF